MMPEKILKKFPQLKKQRWKKLGDRGGNSVLNREHYVIGFSKKFVKKHLNINYGQRNSLFVEPSLFICLDDFDKFKELFIKKIESEKGYAKKVIKGFYEKIKNLLDFVKKLPKNLDLLSNKQLYLIFKKASEKYADLVTYAYINLNEEDIPNTLIDNIIERLGVDSSYKLKLIVPKNKKTIFMNEKIELMKLSSKIKDINNLLKDEENEIKKHMKKHPYLKSKYFNSNEISYEETIERLKKGLGNFEDNKKVEIIFKKTAKKVKLKGIDADIIDFLREMLFLKTQRKETICVFSYYFGKLIEEFAKRQKITKEMFVSQTLVEIKEFIEGKKTNKKELEKRVGSFAHICLDMKTTIVSDVNFKHKKIKSNIDEIKGITGNSGFVAGKVSVITDNSKLKDIEKGTIVVMDSIRPDDVLHLHNVSGIITNHGGMLSHAVLLSRELGIPSLVNTQNATFVLNDGDFIELHADKGIAKKKKSFSKKWDLWKVGYISMGLCRADIQISSHVHRTKEVIGEGHDDIFILVKNNVNVIYFTIESMKKTGKAGLEKLSDKNFIKKNKEEVNVLGKKIYSTSDFIQSLPLKHMEKEELFVYYDEIVELMRQMFGYFNVTQPSISHAIEEKIEELTLNKYDADSQYKIMEIMMKPDCTTLIEEEEIDLIKIALKIKTNPSLVTLLEKENKLIFDKINHMKNSKFFKDLVFHQSKYSFLASSENFDEFYMKYFIDRIKEFIKKDKKDLIEEIKNKLPDKEGLLKERQKIINEYRLSEELVHFIDVARDYSHQRMLTRIIWTKGIQAWGKILREFARKMNLSEAEIQYVLKDEIKRYIKEGKIPKKDEIEKRMQTAIYCIFDRKPAVILTGQEADEFYKNNMLPLEPKTDYVKGRVASKGKKIGKVKIFAYGKNMQKQIEEMQKGEILVTGNTRPDMIVALKKASAIVTNEGGIMSHAALVSREFGIPCVVGTKYATEVFKDGDLIEVDAEKGVVKKISE